MRTYAATLCLLLLTGCPDGGSEAQEQAESDGAPTPDGAPTSDDASTPDDSSPQPQSDAHPPTDATTQPQGKALPLVVSAALAKSINAFGVDLYGQVRRGPGNVAISPLSVTLALAMTYGGAKGATASQMAKALHHQGQAEVLHSGAAKLLASVSTQGPRANELRIANRLFGQESFTFEQPFLTLTKERYLAPMEQVDFAQAPEKGRNLINRWVASQTADRIPEILPAGSISRETRLALVNALYFNGRWARQFEKQQTRDASFFVNGQEEAQVPTMHQTGRHGYHDGDGFDIIQLSYVGGHLAMSIILPDERDGLSALESSLTDEQLVRWLSNLSSIEVDVALPRFTLEMEPLRLNDALQQLGMRAPFSRTDADFTAMANPPVPDDRLFIQHVFHRTFVDVTEQGTEAAASTAVVMDRLGGLASGPPQFHADHPFLFVIHTKQPDAIPFIGRVNDPR